MADTVRTGLVGAGPWATVMHAPLLAGGPGTSLDVVWARRQDAAAELALRYGAAAAGSFEELLDQCDAVAFAVPPDVQAALAVRAAEAGKHLLLEKPVATILGDAERLAAAVDRAGVRSQLVLTIRYRPEVRAYLDGLRSAEVRYVRGSYLGTGGLPGSPFATSWRQRSPAAALLDVGPHTVDLVEAVAGPVTEVRAAVRGGVTTASTVHAGGAVGQLALSITTADGPGGVDLDVVTDAGFTSMPTAPADEVTVWRTITDELAATVSGPPHPLDVHHGVRLQRVLDAVARSATAGHPVLLPT